MSGSGLATTLAGRPFPGRSRNQDWLTFVGARRARWLAHIFLPNRSLSGVGPTRDGKLRLRCTVDATAVAY
jgi:hypothetical protein